MGLIMKGIVILILLVPVFLCAEQAYATNYEYSDALGYGSAWHRTDSWQKLGSAWDTEAGPQVPYDSSDDGIAWSTNGGATYGHEDIFTDDLVIFKFTMYRATTGAHEYDQLKVWIDAGQDGTFDHPARLSGTWSDNSQLYDSNVNFGRTGNSLQSGNDTYIRGQDDLDLMFGAKWYKGGTYEIDNGQAVSYDDRIEEFFFALIVPDGASGDFWLRARASCDHTLFENVTPYGELWQGEVEDWKITVNPVPEPTTMLLFGTGLIGLAGIRKRKSKQV